MIKNVGFVSTRFSGTDGISLEACKWADVFEQNGYRCFWFAGEIDRDAEKSFLVPEAHFRYEQNQWINEQILGTKQRSPRVTRTIHDLRSLLKVQLHKFIHQFSIDLLIAENVLTIPMHVPFGLALTETIAETQIPTISHNHDFFWERMRFSRNAVNDYLRMAFPPGLPIIKHVVINSEAQEQLALRTGVSSTIIPNVLNFEHPPVPDEAGILAFRESIGLSPDDRMILQPTRIVKRKGIESAIELVKQLDDPRNKLVISHEAGDEGFEYAEWLKDYACEHRVDLRLVSGHISDPWTRMMPGKSGCSLWDVYPFADFITYPSRYEGFGNAFLEAVYFKKPLLINRYSTFVRDIEPLGFDLITMDGYLSKETVREVRSILEFSERRREMVDQNFRIASRHYSYSVLRGQLNGLLTAFFGDDARLLREHRQVPRYDNILHLDPRSVSCQFFNSDNCHLGVGTSL